MRLLISRQNLIPFILPDSSFLSRHMKFSFSMCLYCGVISIFGTKAELFSGSCLTVCYCNLTEMRASGFLVWGDSFHLTRAALFWTNCSTTRQTMRNWRKFLWAPLWTTVAPHAALCIIIIMLTYYFTFRKVYFQLKN